MVFSSAIFIFAFAPIVLIVAALLRRFRGGHAAVLAWLTFASFFFYGYWRPDYLVIICVSVIANWFLGEWIRGAGESNRIPLYLGVLLNLLGIGYYKYLDFLILNANTFVGTEWALQGIVLPLGISFFTFQQIAYLVDTSRGLTSRTSLLEYAFFVSFFPQLIAGPIVHHRHILPRVREANGFQVDAEGMLRGLHAFSIGFAKKIVIADTLAIAASSVFNAADAGELVTRHDAILGTLSYTFQIYFDFSGYSDMAVGLGLMFGFQLPQNFNSPYRATGIIEFWRRWHITLSEFLRDYVYIPLGGNRLGETRRYLNLLATMLIGGLWHGASWTFVLWGGLHGIMLAANHLVRASLPRTDSAVMKSAVDVLSASITFLLVAIAWIPFRSETWSGMSTILRAIFYMQDRATDWVGFVFNGAEHAYLIEISSGSVSYSAWGWVGAAAGVAFLFPNTWTLAERFAERSGGYRLQANTFTVATFGVACFAMLYHTNRVSEFIYFNF